MCAAFGGVEGGEEEAGPAPHPRPGALPLTTPIHIKMSVITLAEFHMCVACAAQTVGEE